jgi:hypothetical protein
VAGAEMSDSLIIILAFALAIAVLIGMIIGARLK